MQERTGQYEAMMEAVSDGVAIHDGATTEVEAANGRYAQLLGLAEDDVEGATLDELLTVVTGREQLPLEEAIEAARAGQTVTARCVSTADPEQEQQELRCSLERADVDGEQTLLTRLEVPEASSLGIEPLAVQMTETGVWRWEVGSGTVVWNEEFERLLGMEHGEFRGSYEDFAERVPNDDLEQLEKKIEQSLETGDMFGAEFRMHHEDGHQIWVEGRGQPTTTTEGVQRFVGTVTDITDRKRREHEAEELSTHLELALGGASPALWEWDRETDQVYWNDRFGQLIGIAEEDSEAFHSDVDSLMDRIHPEDRERVQEAIQTGIEDEEIYEAEFRVDRDGEWAWLSGRGRLMDQDGANRVVGITRDVTDRKRYEAELRKSNEELERLTDQMEFFNSILRHDVLNGMTVIKTRASLLADQLEGEQAQYAETIVEWCNTTTEVTERVRDVIKTLTAPEDQRQLEPIDLTPLLEGKVGELRDAYAEITFESDLEAGVEVRADELLADALGNVLSNSIEHNETEGLRIETTLTTEGDTARVAVADNGRGIDDARKDAIFRRGETSHAKETGSGFGLFYVDVMIRRYGGDVWVEDSEESGARFVMELPLANGGSD